MLNRYLSCGRMLGGLFWFLVFVALAPFPAHALPKSLVCDAKALGAKADGTTLDTGAIQRAIDRCAGNGGGIARLTSGTFLSGPLQLKSGVTLQLDKGATLRGVSDFSAYPVRGDNIWQGAIQQRPLALVYAVGEENVGIRGYGTIDGGGAVWWKAYHERKAAGKGEMPRPFLIQFSHCTHVLVEDVTFKDSPSYTVVPYYSSDVQIRGIRILAPPDSPNTDGVAPYSSHHVVIADCMIDTGDDNIAIKSSKPLHGEPDSSASDITVRNCVFKHGHGVTIGADTGGGVHQVLIENSSLEGTTNGLRIKSGRGFGGEVDHIVYRNITMQGASPAVSFTGYYPSIPAEDTAQPADPQTPSIHDIHLINVQASGGAEIGVIVGLPESVIRGVEFDRCTLSAARGLVVRNAELTLKLTTLNAQSGEPITKQNNAAVRERH